MPLHLSRKGLINQVNEKITPDTQKSATDQVTESATSMGDKAMGVVQPGMTICKDQHLRYRTMT